MSTRSPYANASLFSRLSDDHAAELAAAVQPHIRSMIRRCHASTDPVRLRGGSIRSARAQGSLLVEVDAGHSKTFAVTPRGAQLAELWLAAEARAAESEWDRRARAWARGAQPMV